MDILALGLGWYAAYLLSVTLHEAAHAGAALCLGDRTAYRGGQVTLDPLPHIRREPLGMVVIPLLSYALQGWMVGWGSAPYDPQWAWEHPRRSAWMALAGPAANLFLVLLAALIIRLGLWSGLVVPAASLSFTRLIEAPEAASWLGGLTTFVSIAFSLNVTLCLFNLLPVPPLDGSAAVLLILERHTARRFLEALWNPRLSLFGLIISWQVFAYLFAPLYVSARRYLLGF